MNRVIPFIPMIFLLAACQNTTVSENDLMYISDEDGVIHDCNITDSVLGIDISHHNGSIAWEVLHQHHPEIEFVYIRATVGLNKDSKYEEYVNGAKQIGIKTGAYHYYWANRNSTVQFNNFKSRVKKGDHNLIPVLDIEKPSKYGPANLRRGLSNWLKLAEEEYG